MPDFTNVKDFITELATWYSEFDEQFYGSVVFSTAGDFSEDIANLSAGLSSLSGLMDALAALKDKVATMSLVDLVSLTGRLTVYFGQLNAVATALSALEDAGDARAKINSMNDALVSVQTLIETATGLSGSEDALTDASTVLGNLVASLTEMSSYIQEIAAEWNEAMIDGMNFDSFVSAVTSGMNSVTAKLNSYKSKFSSIGVQLGNSLKQGLRSSLSNVNVSINVHATLGAVSGISSIVNSTANAIRNGLAGINFNVGGVVYRAGGGNIFKSRGTDTVPAMLTPGEYVHRRAAVNKFGLDFMNKINNLDIDGALRSLYARAGGNSGISTVNNTVNNNQQFNITTNNPNFASKLNSRFVGAL